MKQFIIIFFISISLKGFSQRPVFVCAPSGNLYSLDLFNCTSRLIGNSGEIFDDIAFTPDGKLWGVNNAYLYQIDTSNASATYIGFSPPATYSSSLVALNDSTLLGESNSILYGISTKNAQSYVIGSLGEYYACGDLTWYKDTLYMSGCEQLIKIVLNSTYTSIISATPVGSLYPNQFLGLATVSFNGLDSIIGFNGLAYRISAIDAASISICDNIVIPANGAASLSYPSSLPVDLLNFTSILLNKTVQLQWQTTSEINSSYFSIERSLDDVNFSSIGKIAAAGNSSSVQQYTFIDNSPLATNYYRLKEVDLDGKYTYSKILLVKLAQREFFMIVGNPAQNNLEVQINDSQFQTNTISIFDFTGRRLKTFNIQNGLQNIDVSYLPSGTYILQMITSDGQVYNKFFVKAN